MLLTDNLALVLFVVEGEIEHEPITLENVAVYISLRVPTFENASDW